MNSTTAMDFIDTNILLYRISSDPNEREKQRIASDLLERDDLCLSVQVLQEFYVQATRESRDDALRHDEACDLIASWNRFHIQETTVQLFHASIAAKQRWRISFWDAAIIEAARLQESTLVYSEDLNDGQDFDGVLVKNPFHV